MIEKEFRPDALYNKIVHFYIDKKGYHKDKANVIAQLVVQREAQKRICRTDKCGHFSHDHLRNTEICLIVDCVCRSFTSSIAAGLGERAAAKNHDRGKAATIRQ